MEPIRVVVNGALGKMGKEVTRAVDSDSSLRVVGAGEMEVSRESLALPISLEEVPFASDIGSLIDICKPDVIVDFTTAASAVNAARTAIKKQVNVVIGTTNNRVMGQH